MNKKSKMALVWYYFKC